MLKKGGRRGLVKEEQDEGGRKVGQKTKVSSPDGWIGAFFERWETVITGIKARPMPGGRRHSTDIKALRSRGVTHPRKPPQFPAHCAQGWRQSGEVSHLVQGEPVCLRGRDLPSRVRRRGVIRGRHHHRVLIVFQSEAGHTCAVSAEYRGTRARNACTC